MKKVFVFVLMFLCIAGSMDAAGYRGKKRGRSHGAGGDSYTHSVGGMVGNMYGASYKGFIFGVDGLALQADLAVKMQLSPVLTDIKLSTGKEFHKKYNWSNFTFELNPNLVYQKELGSAGRSTFAMFGGGGVSLGFIQSLNLASLGAGDKNPFMGKFGVNGIVGMEFIWSHFVLSLDARPGYGLAFSNKYAYRSGPWGTELHEVEADRNHVHFFDFGASIGFRYCF